MLIAATEASARKSPIGEAAGQFERALLLSPRPGRGVTLSRRKGNPVDLLSFGGNEPMGGLNGNEQPHCTLFSRIKQWLIQVIATSRLFAQFTKCIVQKYPEEFVMLIQGGRILRRSDWTE